MSFVVIEGDVRIAEGGVSLATDDGVALVSGARGFIGIAFDGTNTRFVRCTTGGALHIADGGGSITVDGTVAVTDGGGSLSVDDGGGSLTVDGTVTGNQGTAGSHAQRWMVGLSDGSGFISPATDRVLATAPFSTRLSDGSAFISPALDRTLATAPFAFRASDGSAFIDIALDRTLATAPFAVRQTDGSGFISPALDRTLATAPFAFRASDGTSFLNLAIDRTLPGAPTATRLSDGSAFYDAAKTGQLPTALSGSGNLKTAVVEALPAGTNNIGDVDVLTLPSIPAGTNRLGSVRLVDANDLALDLARSVAIPANTRGLLIVGEDDTGVARAIDVRVDPLDAVRRLQMEGKVSVTAPSPPPNTTSVTFTFAGALSITTNQTDDYIITNGKRFVLQQLVGGCEGDTSERGSAIEVSYYDGTTLHLVEREYINGFTTQLFPDTEKARDGTVMDGNGTTKLIRVVRRRLSGSAQEVDFVLRGYEYTP